MTPPANGRKPTMPCNKQRRLTVKHHEKASASIIERTLVPLAPIARRAAAAKARSRNLDFRMQCQLQSNWCWAAVATSVARFYDPESKWTQCAVAGKCNIPGHLQIALKKVGHVEDPPYVEGKVPFGCAQREIDAGRPLGVRTQWRHGEGAHFLAIVGYHREFKLLTIADSLFGSSHWHYDAFCRDYRHFGRWVDSYYTKR